MGYLGSLVAVVSLHTFVTIEMGLVSSEDYGLVPWKILRQGDMSTGHWRWKSAQPVALVTKSYHNPLCF